MRATLVVVSCDRFARLHSRRHRKRGGFFRAYNKYARCYTEVVMDGYVIDEDKIQQALSYLKIHKPEKATREFAIQWLEILPGGLKKIAFEDPEFAEELESALRKLEQDQSDDDKEENVDTKAD